MSYSIIDAELFINSIESTEDLNRVIDLIKIKQKQLRSATARKVKSQISVGTRIIVNLDGVPQYGTVKEVKRTRAVVQLELKDMENELFTGRYNVPLGLLKVA